MLRIVGGCFDVDDFLGLTGIIDEYGLKLLSRFR